MGKKVGHLIVGLLYMIPLLCCIYTVSGCMTLSLVIVVATRAEGSSSSSSSSSSDNNSS